MFTVAIAERTRISEACFCDFRFYVSLVNVKMSKKFKKEKGQQTLFGKRKCDDPPDDPEPSVSHASWSLTPQVQPHTDAAKKKYELKRRRDFVPAWRDE